METWGVELVLGFGMNMAVVTVCWISGWRPVDTSNSILWHDAHREDEETIETEEHELSILWNGGTETTIGLVVAVAVMMAVAVEIASKPGSVGIARW
ncbi:hypothetical protein P3T76_006258 [Phytophthora citrophthora]|uniref:Uncharacterized protein n=1 Tax=Phytophthora citrophthora TaxID=4793 RepID=A0AAD9LQ62_9STRA|nr:hypothetical protein P3T76_006258 [Phytophthora citrophthora]